MVSVDYRTSHGGLENTITLLLKEKYIFGWGLEPPITIACIRPCFDMAYIFLYVDDIILITSSHDLRKSIITLFTSEFAIKELNSSSYFLDIVVTRHADGLFLVGVLML
jgi:hypothetical protein